jgi:hypothetical protein
VRSPVISESASVWPSPGRRCPVCQRARVWEPHTFITISGGALKMDRRRDSGGPDESLDGFLELGWHGAHDGGIGPFRDTGGLLYLAESIRGGQFSFAVCSTRCLRGLFRKWVDELDVRIRRAVAKDKSKRPRRRRTRR